MKRVERKVADLALYKIHPTPAEQTVVFLEGLKSPHLVDPGVQIRTGQHGVYSDWVRDGDLKHTLERANHHIRSHHHMQEKMGVVQHTKRLYFNRIPIHHQYQSHPHPHSHSPNKHNVKATLSNAVIDLNKHWWTPKIKLKPS